MSLKRQNLPCYTLAGWNSEGLQLTGNNTGWNFCAGGCINSLKKIYCLKKKIVIVLGIQIGLLKSLCFKESLTFKNLTPLQSHIFSDVFKYFMCSVNVIMPLILFAETCNIFSVIKRDHTVVQPVLCSAEHWKSGVDWPVKIQN